MLFGKIKSQYGPRLRSFLYRKKLRVSTRSLKFWVTQLLKPPQECSVSRASSTLLARTNESPSVIHNSEIAVKPARASRVVYCELIGKGDLIEQIQKLFFFLLPR